MDYESRKVKWYWFLLYMIYCAAVVYLLFQGNPLLYSRHELRASLEGRAGVQHQTIPAAPDTTVKLTGPTGPLRYGPERAAADPLSAPRGKNYEEFEKHPVDFGGEEFNIQQVVQDASGIYITGKSPWVVALALDGQARWKYHFKDPVGEGIPTVLLDQNSAYLIHPKGEIVVLNKGNGEIRWVAAFKQEVVAQPILWKNDILVPSKGSTGLQFSLINRLTGQLEDSPRVDIKPGFRLSEAPALGQLIATVDNKIIAIDPEEWAVLWTQVLTDPVKGYAVVNGPQIFAATLGAKVVKLDGNKKGKLDWEADIEKPAASSPAFLPVVNRLAVMDTGGALSAIDAKTGKLLWRNAVENRNPLHETWTARLSGKYIEEFKMDWLHKGWSIWTACSENRFCIFTPNKGQMINRLQLSGKPLFLPLAIEKRWVFLTEPKPGHYQLSHMVEEAEIKRLRATTTVE